MLLPAIICSRSASHNRVIKASPFPLSLVNATSLRFREIVSLSGLPLLESHPSSTRTTLIAECVGIKNRITVFDEIKCRFVPDRRDRVTAHHLFERQASPTLRSNLNINSPIMHLTPNPSRALRLTLHRPSLQTLDLPTTSFHHLFHLHLYLVSVQIGQIDVLSPTVLLGSCVKPCDERVFVGGSLIDDEFYGGVFLG